MSKKKRHDLAVSDSKQWSLQYTFSVPDTSTILCTLSWGAAEELLVGSHTLRLYQTSGHEALIWSRELSSPVELALFSPDASLIASTARFDRLVKLWRRTSYGSDDVRFDFSYLSHPAAVTGLHWRNSGSKGQINHNVLYTTSADNFVRVWAATDLHASQLFQLWTKIDLQESIQPRYLDTVNRWNARYVFFIDSDEFSSATKSALKLAKNTGQPDHGLEHLVEIAERNPDLCVVLDDRGHMSAWGLENIGSRSRKVTDVFNVALIENFNLLLPQKVSQSDTAVRLLSFFSGGVEASYAVLVHHFDGRIVWLEGRVDEFFDPSPGKARLHLKSLWTGHQGSIKKIIRSMNGKALISRTNDNEGLIWKQRHGKGGMALTRASFVDSPDHIHRTWLLADGRFTVNLHHESISLWDTEKFKAKQVARSKFQIHGKLLCLLQLPSPDHHSSFVYLATITSHMKGIVWEVILPEYLVHNDGDVESGMPKMTEYCKFDLGVGTDLSFVVPIDPAGSPPILTGPLDTFAKDVALSYTEAGVLQTWTAKVNPEDNTVDWLPTSTFATGIDRPFLASGSSTRKIALVNSPRNGLTIWDTCSAQLEFDKEYSPQEVVQDLDWTSTPDQQSILAVGFPYKVIVLAQIRYDYLDKGPAWAPIREISIRESTPHPIGDSTWLGSGNLVIGAGTQLFVYDKLITTSDEMITDLSIPAHGHASVDLFDVVALLNGSLPVYHPQFLAQCIMAGRLSQVSKIIISLNKALKFFDGDHLDSLLAIPAEEFFTNGLVSSSNMLLTVIFSLTLTGQRRYTPEREAF